MNNCFKKFKKMVRFVTITLHKIQAMYQSYYKLQFPSWPTQWLTRTQHGTWLGTLKDLDKKLGL